MMRCLIDQSCVLVVSHIWPFSSTLSACCSLSTPPFCSLSTILSFFSVTLSTNYAFLLRDCLYLAFQMRFGQIISCPQSCLDSSLKFDTLPIPLSCPFPRNLSEDSRMHLTEDTTLFCSQSVRASYDAYN